MFVCICRGVTERDIDEAIQEGDGTFEQIQQRFGVAKGCGQCSEYAQKYIENSHEYLSLSRGNNAQDFDAFYQLG